MKILSYLPSGNVSNEYVLWSIDPHTCRSKLYYSSNKALYNHYKRQFDAANKLAVILKRENTHGFNSKK